MAYTAPTVDDIRSRFPDFLTVNEDVIKNAIEDAASYVSTSWLERDYLPAYRLIVAHLIMRSGAVSSSAPTLVNGVGVRSFSLGDASVTFDGPTSGSNAADAELESTTYGRRFKELRAKNFSGPWVP